MALIACPECGRQVSSAAARCPGCAFPVAARGGAASDDIGAGAAPTSDFAPQPPPMTAASPGPQASAQRPGDDAIVAHVGSSVIRVREKSGMASVTLTADVDGRSVLNTKVSLGTTGNTMLSAGGAQIDMRWNLSDWGTSTIVLLRDHQVVASRGAPKDVAALVSPRVVVTQTSNSSGSSSAGAVVGLLALVFGILLAAVVPVLKCSDCGGSGFRGVADELFGDRDPTCGGDGRQTVWEIVRASL